MIELSRTQDEEVGDGTTSVIILAGEILHLSQPFLEKDIHPTVIVRAYMKAPDAAIKVIDDLAFPIDVDNRDELMNIVASVPAPSTPRLRSAHGEPRADAVLRRGGQRRRHEGGGHQEARQDRASRRQHRGLPRAQGR